MPIIRISMFEGRDIETKRQLIDEITASVAKNCGVSPANVHVIIDEMPHSNWGRGSVVAADRSGKAPVEELGFFSVSDLETVPERREEYLAYRSESVHPTMATMPGYGGSFVGQDTADENHFILLIRWKNKDARTYYQNSREHDQLRDKIRGELTKRMDIYSYVRLDLTHGGQLAHGDPAPSYIEVATHRVLPGKEGTFFELRKLEVHPDMASFDGFLSSVVLRAQDEENAYMVVNQWASKDAADAFNASAMHRSLQSQTLRLLTETPVVQRYNVLDL